MSLLRSPGSGNTVIGDLPVFNCQNTPAPFGKCGIMGDKDKSGTGRTGGLKQGGDHSLAGAAVQIAGRFISKQDARARRYGARDGHTLLFTARQLIWQMGHAVLKADRCQRGGGAFLRILPTSKFQRYGHILYCCHRRDQTERLKHNADMVAPQRCQRIFRHAGDVKPGKVDPA
jgi:hypothetical protein